MHTVIPETKVSRGLVLAATRQGWTFAIQDSTPNMAGLNYISYGKWPWLPPYENGARTMVFCWNAGKYRHAKY